METKELKIQAPEGYEIDKENSTLECIRFKPIKKDITYNNICDIMLKGKKCYYISDTGNVRLRMSIVSAYDKVNAINDKQLERLLALNQLFNIAEYYNKLHPIKTSISYVIIGYIYEKSIKYGVDAYNPRDLLYGVVVLFNNKEDAQTVIDNPNFREILDTIYKD